MSQEIVNHYIVIGFALIVAACYLAAAVYALRYIITGKGNRLRAGLVLIAWALSLVVACIGGFALWYNSLPPTLGK